jgi:putative ABC transport system permease protein
MRRVTLRSLWGHRRRLLSTVLAIVLGVGFMSGTFILSTTLDQVADDLFRDVYDEVDAFVEGPMTVDLLDRVRQVEGVEAASPRVATEGAGGTNRVVTAGGWALGSEIGPATVFESWIDEPDLNPFRITDGRPPETDREIAMNLEAVENAGARVGDPLTIVGQFGPEPYTLVGVFTAGAAKSAGGGVSVEFTLAEAQRLAGTRGRIDSVLVAAEDGVSAEALVTRIGGELDADGVRVITGTQAAKELSRGDLTDLGFLRMVLVVFGVVALLVGTFVIANTFAILVAQRTRELALLRALGASRPQVFASVLSEAAIVGVISAGVGLFVGTYLATWINRGLDEIGAELPTETLVIRTDTIVLSLCMGIFATLAAAVLPAVRATRVSPLAAIRDVAIDRSNASGRRVLTGVVAIVVGTWWCSDAWRSEGAAGAIPVVGLGAVLVVGGVIVIGPLLAGRTVALPRGLLARVRGITGRLAAENAARSPRRTSATASAILISVALVVFVTAFASSAVQSVEDDARRGFQGDFIVTGPGGLSLPNGVLSSPISPKVVDAVRAVPGVAVVAGIGFSNARIGLPDGSTTEEFVTSVDLEGIGPVLQPLMVEGEAEDLDDDGIIVDRLMAREHDLSIGDHVTYRLEDGPLVSLEVQGVSDDPNLLGYFTVSRATYASVAAEVRDVQVGGSIEAGADLATVIAGVDRAITGSPGVWVLEREAFIDDLKEQIGSFINVIYGLLILSVLISVLGIANTLSLTIHERTRELGLLRAVGMDRRGVRSTVRWEAVLISAFGMVVGLVVGTALSVAVVTSLREFGLVSFAVPAGALAVIAGGAVGLGLVSSVRPAQRAARVSILDAIATD